MANESKKIRGPFWTADVDIVQNASPKTVHAFRSLFLELQPRQVDVGALHVPGTVLLLCFVRKVTVNLGSDLVFTRPTSDEPPSPSSSAEALHDLVVTGQLALLLCSIDPSTWTEDWDVDVLPEAVCLAGDVSLDVLEPEDSARTKLYAALSIIEASLGQRLGSARLIGALTVHASGLTAFGRIALPWEVAPLAAPLQVAKEIPRVASATADTVRAIQRTSAAGRETFRITVEEARLTADERQAWIASWGHFARAVDPGNPAFQAPGSSRTAAPSWVTMDVGNLDRLPPGYCWSTIFNVLGVLFLGEISSAFLPSKKASWTPKFRHLGVDQQYPPVFWTPDIPPIPASVRTLTAIVRDFPDTHPDFEAAISGLVPGLVASMLGANGKPLFVGPEGNGSITSAETFQQWFTDVPDVNQTLLLPLELRETAPGSAIFAFESAAFFPIDEQLLGNQGRAHNYHFTLELHTTFLYRGGEVLQFTGDDDLWVFIDQRLAVDLGGIHGTETGTVALDSLGLSVGQTYALDVFYAERHTEESTFQLQTTLAVPQPSMPALQGAVVFGNDKPGVLASRVSEQPWSVVLLDAQSITGTWTVSMATAAMPALTKIELEFGSPELVLNGFIWMAPEAPTAEDALPRLEDWRSGLVSLALATVAPDDAFPSPMQFTVDSLTFAFEPGTATAFPSATLGAWQARYEADRETLRAMVDKRLLPDTLFSQTRPLVWRRHGALPMVQALPLTQSQSPPSHPSSSRQLAPFQLPVAADSAAGGLVLPSGWLFGVLEGQQAASSWPRLLSAATVADEWGVDLPMVSLSLLGLILDPRIAAATTGLPADASLNLAVQLRYDLPYTDEPNALAQVPKIPRRPGEVGPTPADPLPTPPPRTRRFRRALGAPLGADEPGGCRRRDRVCG